MDESGMLIFERRATYLDRAVRYLVEVDGVPQSPRLVGPQTVEVPVAPGEHVVRVSYGREKFFQADIPIDHDETKRLRIVPGPLLSLRRQPRLVEISTGRRLAGTVGRRSAEVIEHLPRHRQ